MASKKELTANIKHMQDQIKDLEDRFKRALADYQNLEKRHTSQKNNFVKYANETLLDKLLPLVDDLERAQTHLRDQGIGLIVDQFYQVLSSESVFPIKTDGQLFDPQTMDCVEVVLGPKNRVVTTLTKGYFYHDRVLRPARVKVGGGKSK